MERQDHHTDEFFMQRAMDLALLGAGQVSPNPMVGCVIVHNNRIIGEGWHRQYGGHHAEVRAVNDVKDKTLLSESTAYVNLEPCAHFGKTPPCADMLVKEKIKRVVISNGDPNPLVAGKGIKILKSAGIEVTTGVLGATGREINKRFFTFVEKQRPYVLLKWAETADHFIARQNHDSTWISSDLSRQLVHQWRTVEDAVMVGTRTAEKDNPQLNVRYWTGRNPVRIVIDKNLTLSPTLALFNGTQRTLCYTLREKPSSDNVQYIELASENFEEQLLKDLCTRKIQSVIIEGGTKTLQSFIQLGLWDEARIFRSEKTFGDGIASPIIEGRQIGRERIQSDTLIILKSDKS